MNPSLKAHIAMLQQPVAEPSMQPDLDDIDEKADAHMQ